MDYTMALLHSGLSLTNYGFSKIPSLLRLISQFTTIHNSQCTVTQCVPPPPLRLPLPAVSPCEGYHRRTGTRGSEACATRHTPQRAPPSSRSPFIPTRSRARSASPYIYCFSAPRYISMRGSGRAVQGGGLRLHSRKRRGFKSRLPQLFFLRLLRLGCCVRGSGHSSLSRFILAAESGAQFRGHSFLSWLHGARARSLRGPAGRRLLARCRSEARFLFIGNESRRRTGG